MRGCLPWRCARKSINGDALSFTTSSKEAALEAFLRIQKDRHRPVIHQLDLHHLLEASGLAAQAERANALDEVFVKLPGLFGARGIVERWALAFPHIAIQRELRDREN